MTTWMFVIGAAVLLLGSGKNAAPTGAALMITAAAFEIWKGMP